MECRESYCERFEPLQWSEALFICSGGWWWDKWVMFCTDLCLVLGLHRCTELLVGFGDAVDLRKYI